MRRSGYQLFVCQLLALLVLAKSSAAQSGDQTSSSPIGSPPIHSQPPTQPQDDTQVPTALVRSVRVIPGESGASVEILATRPLTPAITTVENPTRLVVDLPKSLVGSALRIKYRDPQVEGVRVDQFHRDPPTVRLVIDLAKETIATWDAAGNRLMIRLHPPAPISSETSPSSAFTQGIAPAMSSSGGDVTGVLVLAGARVATGSSVTAGSDTAILHMAKGGEARICPGTTVSVTSSQNGRDLMLGMNTGSLEAHYQLDASVDSILTPDFRILFGGPGDFDYAVSADSRGNTCVRALPGNTGSAVVSELMGNGMYQVGPAEQVVFRSGHLASRDQNVPEDCGCPTASVPVLRAEAAPTQASGGPAPGQPPPDEPAVARPHLSEGSETASLPTTSLKDVHIQVDAPMVFRAADRQPHAEPGDLPLSSPQRAESLPIIILAPTSLAETGTMAQTTRKGFLEKVRGFFGGIFR